MRTDQEIKAACERSFQNGGGKVHIVAQDGAITSSPSPIGAKAALRCAYPGERVFARRKVRGERRYEWMLIGRVNLNWEILGA